MSEVEQDVVVSKQKRNEKPIKNVWGKQCVGTIFFCIFALLVVLIPVNFVDMTMAYNVLPFIGDSSIFETQAILIQGFGAFSGLEDTILKTLQLVLYYATYGYLGIVALNIVFSLLLIVTRSVTLRVIFKILSILFGFAMIAIMAAHLIYLGGYIGIMLTDMSSGAEISNIPDNNALLFGIAVSIMSGLLIKRQFCWYARLY